MGGGRRLSVTTGARRTWGIQLGCATLESPTSKAKWYLRVAEGGNVRAMYNISLCYSYGEGLSQDPVRAKRWLQLAADCGHKKALMSVVLNFVRWKTCFGSSCGENRVVLENCTPMGLAKMPLSLLNSLFLTVTVVVRPTCFNRDIQT
ncbi:uncharacterized protein [Miscanthus floridulus]|uniref:uncharacterized protein isoform X3 n=1 Tax=Miscanthus floridulus TaxID=154761 RepID=UPI00345B2BDC